MSKLMSKHEMTESNKLFSIANYGEIGNYYSYDSQDFSYSCYSKTVTFWAKMNDAIGKGAFFKIGNSGNNGYGFGVTTSNGGFEDAGNYIRCLYEGVVWVGAQQVNDLNEWHHYACVIRSANGNYSNFIYKDGNLIANFSNSAIVKQATNGIAFAGYDCITYAGEIFNRCLTGKMTRICMFDRQLNQDEVLRDFQCGHHISDVEGLSHFWMPTRDDSIITDSIGTWHLTKKGISITISKDTPWI